MLTYRTVDLVEEPPPAHDDGDSGVAPPASDFPPKQKRSNEFWLALASIFLALAVSAIAVGSGWYTANQHDKQETMRQKVSSTRSQQKDAYAGFINSASDLAIAIQLQVKAIENRYPYFLYSPIPEEKADLEKKFIDFGHALDLAQLWGSARVRDDSNKVFEAAEQSRFVIIGWGVAHPGNDPNSAPCPELLAFENKTESNRQELGNAIDRFNDAAREDLGIPALAPTSTPPEPLLPKDACANYPH
jgi:hypothetical protein